MSKYRWNIKIFARNILCIISVLYLSWIFISLIEIVSKNLYPNPEYHIWNFFDMICRYAGGIM